MVRRPSRRQRTALIVLLLLAAAFITLDYRGTAFGGLRSGAETVFGPVQRGLASVFGPVGRFLGGIPHLGSNRSDIDALRRENDDLRRQLAEQALDRSRSEQLYRLQLLSGLGGYRVLPARVVSLGPSLGFEWTVTIDAGSADGVRPDMTVVAGTGLAGRVKQVGRTTSLVVLAADPGTKVGARVAGSGELGLAAGNGTGPMGLTLLNPNAQVHPGDRLVTGPFGESTYVAGVPIGEIVSVGGDTGGAGPRTATVRGYVNPSRLDVVGVVLVGPRTDPRDAVLPAVLPPPPSPTGTPTPPTTGTVAPTGATSRTGAASPTASGSWVPSSPNPPGTP
jgi:rod shape-determining protein MreC